MASPVVLPVAQRWFQRTTIDDAITLLWEPHVVSLMRCNIWHVRGRDRDLVVDTGMGVQSLTAEMADLLDKPVTAVATHGHDDHIGSHHEFDDVVAHPLEAPLLEAPPLDTLDIVQGWGEEAVAMLTGSGYELESPYFVDALPPGYVFEQYRQLPARVTRRIVEGDIVDTGDRAFEVLHLPGHSPGSIGLWDAASGTLFSGDALYDGPLLDELPESNISDYCATMERLLTLPVDVVHAGHDPSFGRARLHELCRAYLSRRT
jgi:glyoxylase-like metal-dependent hydrolase (beta-lactamase superfamily II)